MNGAVPEVPTLCEYAEPTLAPASVPVVIDGATAAASTATENAFESLPAAFVAVIVNVAEPTVVGVPEMTPVAESNTNPAGRLP